MRSVITTALLNHIYYLHDGCELNGERVGVNPLNTVCGDINKFGIGGGTPIGGGIIFGGGKIPIGANNPKKKMTSQFNKKKIIIRNNAE